MWTLNPGLEPSPHVGYARRGGLGLIVLDRPRAINSLTLDMVTSLRAQLEAWRDDDEITAVAITGAGERGLCAGGDVVAVRRGVLAGGEQAEQALSFFAVEYEVNRLIAHFPKPYVSLMEGVTMGGGIGVACHGSVRLVDPRAKVAMPETIIGFFPDVGARHLLAHCPGQVGAHLVMTGATVTGAEAVRLGLGDALVSPDRFPEILQRYADGESPALSELGETAPAAPLADDRAWIDECYAGDDPVTILDRLRAYPDERAAIAAHTIESRSPLAVCLALASLRRAEALDDIDAVLDEDLAIAGALAYEPDFHEGVRAQLVDKDRTPRWEQSSLREVDPERVAAIMAGVRRSEGADETARSGPSVSAPVGDGRV